MAERTRYAALVGKRVEAYYRAGDLHMSAVGTLVADNGKAISIEDNFSQSGKNKLLRVEIPYDYIIRIVESSDESDPPASK